MNLKRRLLSLALAIVGILLAIAAANFALTHGYDSRSALLVGLGTAGAYFLLNVGLHKVIRGWPDLLGGALELLFLGW